MRFSLGATIPVKTYGNLQPTLEVEAPTFEEAAAQITPYIEALWARYVDDGKPLRGSMERQKLTAFAGGEIYFDPLTHTYTNEAGEVYLSGSQYAAQFEKPFDAPMIAGKMADKYNASAKKIVINAQDIIDMWQLKSEVSMGFGTAIHAALELYGKYRGLAESLDKTTHLHDHPVIKKAVESFYDAHSDTLNVELEALIVDHEAKRAGRIDRLQIDKERHQVCRIQDYKTNADITKHLPSYWKQLEFYGSIMVANGWIVEGYDIFHWNGEWHTYTREVKEDKSGD